MNIAFLSGNITKDPTEIPTKSGVKMTVFSLAVKDNRCIKDEEGKYVTYFFKMIAFGKNAEIILEHYKKGDYLNVVTNIEVNEWTDDKGVKRQETVFKINQIEFSYSLKSKE